MASAKRARSGLLGVARLVGFHVRLAAAIDHALAVADDHVPALEADAHHEVEAGDGRGAGAGTHQFHLADVLAHDREGIDQRRAGDDGGAVLVVVEHRDLHALAQLVLDVETFRRLDVLEIHAAQGRLQGGDHIDQLVRVALRQLDVEDVDAGELLEQHALAFHHRLGRQRPDVAETEHGGAVGDDAHEIGAGGQFARLSRVGDDGVAGRRHARRIGERQIALVGETLGGNYRDLAGGRVAVVFQRGGGKILVHGDSRSLSLWAESLAAFGSGGHRKRSDPHCGAARGRQPGPAAAGRPTKPRHGNDP